MALVVCVDRDGRNDRDRADVICVREQLVGVLGCVCDCVDDTVGPAGQNAGERVVVVAVPDRDLHTRQLVRQRCRCIMQAPDAPALGEHPTSDRGSDLPGHADHDPGFRHWITWLHLADRCERLGGWGSP
jgi:hypothetical protein